MSNKPTDQDVMCAFADGSLCYGCEYRTREQDALGEYYDGCAVINNNLNNGFCLGAELNCAGSDEVEDDGFVTIHPSFEDL